MLLFCIRIYYMKRDYINLFLLIIWMIVIFLMSSFGGLESSNQSGIIVNFVGNLFHISDIELLTLVVRKAAHFMEYFILGILLYNYFKKSKKSIIFAIIYAISDEIHQLFIGGRSAKIMDVLIDSVGAIMGIIVLNIILTYLIKNRNRK